MEFKKKLLGTPTSLRTRISEGNYYTLYIKYFRMNSDWHIWNYLYGADHYQKRIHILSLYVWKGGSCYNKRYIDIGILWGLSLSGSYSVNMFIVSSNRERIKCISRSTL